MGRSRDCESANAVEVAIRYVGRQVFGRAGFQAQAPADQFHGDRTYRVIDPQGHTWSFSQRLREVTAEEMEAAVPGMKVWTSQPKGARTPSRTTKVLRGRAALKGS